MREMVLIFIFGASQETKSRRRRHANRGVRPRPVRPSSFARARRRDRTHEVLRVRACTRMRVQVVLARIVTTRGCECRLHWFRRQFATRTYMPFVHVAWCVRSRSVRCSLRSFSSFSFSFSFSFSSSPRIDSRVIRRRYPRTGYPKRAARPRFEKKSHRRSSRRW